MKKISISKKQREKQADFFAEMLADILLRQINNDRTYEKYVEAKKGLFLDKK